jgi:hypothetical protein
MSGEVVVYLNIRRARWGLMPEEVVVYLIVRGGCGVS